MILDYIALGCFAILIVAGLAVIVVIGSLPGKIARRRGHPQADAITAAGWISLATLGALWPISFVWAFLRPAGAAASLAPAATNPPGEGAATRDPPSEAEDSDRIHARLEAIEAAIRALEPPHRGDRS
jgi:hypothetical protein